MRQHLSKQLHIKNLLDLAKNVLFDVTWQFKQAVKKFPFHSVLKNGFFILSCSDVLSLYKKNIWLLSPFVVFDGIQVFLISAKKNNP